MRTYRKIYSNLKSFIELLFEKDIVVIINPIVENREGAKIRITWKSPIPEGLVLSNVEFATLSEYRLFLQMQQYTAVLYDGSILQISFDFNGTKLSGHRMCYYPCPLKIDQEIIKYEPILDIIDFYIESNAQIRLRTPLRFDYHSLNITDRHSKTHVHLNKHDCRCSIVAPLSLGHFVHFIFYHFYPLLWNEHEFIRDWSIDFYSRTISRREETLLHLSCRQLVK